MTRRWWLLVVLTAACGVAEAIVMRLAGVPWLSATAFDNAFPIVNFAAIVGALVGAVILTRHPRHRIGWLFCWGQLGVAVGLVGRAITDGIDRGGIAGSTGLSRVVGVAATLLGSQFALAMFATLLLLAPDGRIPSRRWRPLLPGLVFVYVLLTAGVVLIGVGGDPDGVPGLLVAAGQIGVTIVLLAAAVSLLIRMHRATGELRQQLRWIFAAAVVLASAPVSALLVNVVWQAPTPIWAIVLLQLGYLGIPVATGFAVLRYRLYDIDRLMGGSVVLAVLAVLAFAGYVAAIGLLGVLVPGAASNRWLSLAVFVGVVLILQPVRRFARRLADRIVYGPQSMSYDALARFTRRISGAATGAGFLPAVAESAGRLVNAQSCTATVILPDGQNTASWSAAGDGAGLGSSTWVQSISSRGSVVGRLELDVPDYAGGSARRHSLLASFAERVSDGFVHAQLEISLRAHAGELEQLNRALDSSRQRLLAARDIGRRLVAHRIRDEVVERLSPVAELMQQVETLAEPDRAAAADQVDAALRSTSAAIEQLRRITSTVYSRRLAEDGLGEALRAEGRHPGVDLTVVGTARWSAPVESCLFACCSDLLRAVKGAATVQLDQDRDAAVVSLSGAELPIVTGWLDSARELIEVLNGSVAQLNGHVVLRLPLIENEPVQPAVAAPR